VVRERVRQPTPATSLVREFMATALSTGHRGRDVVALLEMFRRLGEAGGGGRDA